MFAILSRFLALADARSSSRNSCVPQCQNQTPRRNTVVQHVRRPWHAFVSFSGNNVPTASDQLNTPFGVVVDSTDNMYVGETGSHRICNVSNGVATHGCGQGNTRISGDNCSATSAQRGTVRSRHLYSTGVSTGTTYPEDSATFLIGEILIYEENT